MSVPAHESLVAIIVELFLNAIVNVGDVSWPFRAFSYRVPN